MKKNITRIIAFVIVLSLAAVCFSACGSKSTWTKTEDGKTLLEIGFIGPLTGEYSNYGISVRNGAKLAVEEINKNGGVNGFELKLLEGDSEASGEKAANVYGKHIDDGMKLSMGAVLSGETKQVVAAAKDDGILVITASGSALDCIKGSDAAFRLCFNDPQQGEIAAQMISDKTLGTKVALLYDNSNDYCIGNINTFKTKAAELGIEIVTEQTFTSTTNTSFDTQLTAIKNSGADLVFLPIYAADAAKILRQAAQMEFNPQWFGVDGLDGLIEKCGENVKDAEDVLLLTPFYVDSTEELTKNFVDNYTAKYGVAPDQFAADGYDVVYTMVKALQYAEFKAETIEEISIDDFNKGMVGAMTKIMVTGVTGTMSWTADGETVKEPLVLQIKDGKTVIYK